MHDALQLSNRKIDAVSLVPLKELLSCFLLRQAEQPKLGRQSNRTVVALAVLDVALPDLLCSCAGKLELRQVGWTAKMIDKGFAGQPARLLSNSVKHFRRGRIFGYVSLRQESGFIRQCQRSWSPRQVTKLRWAQILQFPRAQNNLLQFGVLVDRVRQTEQTHAVFDRKING